MGSDDEFGPDTLAIRAWLAKRAEYAADRDRPAPSASPSSVPAPAPVLGEPAQPAQPAQSAQSASPPDVHQVGRSLLDQLRDEADDTIVFDDEPPNEVATTPPPAYPTPPPRRIPPPSPAPPPAYTAMPSEDDLPPAVIEFKPRTGGRTILGIVLVAAVALTALAAAFAARQPSPATMAVAVVLGLLVLVVWAVRTSATPTRLTVRRNQLEVVRRGERRLIDLASPYTPVAVVGRAGQRGWQVLIEQLDAPLLTLTSRDVDPEPFLQVLHRLRPDLRDAANSTE